MNPVAGQIQKGLGSWKKLGAKVAFLKTSNKKVPRIWLEGKSNKVIIITSGLHLEETSGPLFLLDPTAVFTILQPMLKKDVNFLIYPVINQFGLAYLPSDRPKFLRYNEEGINYNDGWGISSEKKAKEVELVEKDILDTNKTKEIILGVSLHEDSETPAKGYIYTNAIKSRDFRAKLRKEIKSKIDTDFLATKELLLEANALTFQGGTIEEDFCIVDAKDKGSMENWLADDLKIPTILSEGPFGLDLETRKRFHLSVIESIIFCL